MRMRVKFIAVVVISLVLLGGCSIPLVLQPSPTAGQTQSELMADMQEASWRAAEASEYTAVKINEALDKLGPVADTVTDAIGVPIPENIIEKGESVAGRVEAVARNIQQVAAVAAAIPGPQQPIAASVWAIIGAVVTVSGGIAEFFRRRSKKAIKTAVEAADMVPGGGKAVTFSALRNGTADLIHKEHISNGSL